MTATCDLTTRKCVPCEGGVPVLTTEEANELLQQTPGWAISNDGRRISRKFSFSDFEATMAFVNTLADISRAEDHHPDFTAGYNYCEVEYMTHAIGGLSENDFICAAKVNAIAA